MLKIKFIAFCLTLALLGAKSFAQPSIAWQRCYGTSFSDSFSDAIYSHEGGVIAAIDYGGYDGDAEGLYDLSYPATIVKFDSLSEIEWYSSFGGTTNSSYFKQVEENQDGSIIACGGTYSVDGDFADNNGSWDLIMVKMDAFGNKIWSYCYGSTGVDEFESFIQTSDGGYLLCGLSMSSGGDIPGHYGDGFGGDGIVIKTDSMGIVLWAKNLGTSGDDGVAGSILEIDNGFYILNVSCGGDNYDMEGSGISGRKRWLIKMDSLGNVIDENIISGETDLDIGPGREMIYYNEKILIVDGANPLTNYFPDVNGIGGNSDGAIGIFTKDLDFVDLKIYGGSLSDYLYRILVDENENYYLLGLTKSLDVNLTENYDNGLYWDYWILKLDLNFNVMWSRNFGSSGSCSETGCGSFGGQFLLKDNKIYTYIKNEVPDVIPDYDMNCGNQNLLGVPNTDAWLVCFDLTTAIQENYRGNEIINVNPNPVNFSLIVSTTFEENFDISIQSTTGAVVFKQFNNIAKQINISTEFFQNGMYILQVTTASGVKYFEKIIVMH